MPGANTEKFSLHDSALPERIKRLIAGRSFEEDGVGMSEARILILDDCVLKTVKYRRENEDTVRVMQWLEGKLPGREKLRWYTLPDELF